MHQGQFFINAPPPQQQTYNISSGGHFQQSFHGGHNSRQMSSARVMLQSTPSNFSSGFDELDRSMNRSTFGQAQNRASNQQMSIKQPMVLQVNQPSQPVSNFQQLAVKHPPQLDHRFKPILAENGVTMQNNNAWPTTKFPPTTEQQQVANQHHQTRVQNLQTYSGHQYQQTSNQQHQARPQQISQSHYTTQPHATMSLDRNTARKSSINFQPKFQASQPVQNQPTVILKPPQQTMQSQQTPVQQQAQSSWLTPTRNSMRQRPHSTEPPFHLQERKAERAFQPIVFNAQSNSKPASSMGIPGPKQASTPFPHPNTQPFYYNQKSKPQPQQVTSHKPIQLKSSSHVVMPSSTSPQVHDARYTQQTSSGKPPHGSPKQFGISPVRSPPQQPAYPTYSQQPISVYPSYAGSPTTSKNKPATRLEQQIKSMDGPANVPYDYPISPTSPPMHSSTIQKSWVDQSLQDDSGFKSFDDFRVAKYQRPEPTHSPRSPQQQPLTSPPPPPVFIPPAPPLPSGQLPPAKLRTEIDQEQYRDQKSQLHEMLVNAASKPGQNKPFSYKVSTEDLQRIKEKRMKKRQMRRQISEQQKGTRTAGYESNDEQGHFRKSYGAYSMTDTEGDDWDSRGDSPLRGSSRSFKMLMRMTSTEDENQRPSYFTPTAQQPVHSQVAGVKKPVSVPSAASKPVPKVAPKPAIKAEPQPAIWSPNNAAQQKPGLTAADYMNKQKQAFQQDNTPLAFGSQFKGSAEVQQPSAGPAFYAPVKYEAVTQPSAEADTAQQKPSVVPPTPQKPSVVPPTQQKPSVAPPSEQKPSDAPPKAPRIPAGAVNAVGPPEVKYRPKPEGRDPYAARREEFQAEYSPGKEIPHLGLQYGSAKVTKTADDEQPVVMRKAAMFASEPTAESTETVDVVKVTERAEDTEVAPNRHSTIIDPDELEDTLMAEVKTDGKIEQVHVQKVEALTNCDHEDDEVIVTKVTEVVQVVVDDNTEEPESAEEVRTAEQIDFEVVEGDIETEQEVIIDRRTQVIVDESSSTEDMAIVHQATGDDRKEVNVNIDTGVNISTDITETIESEAAATNFTVDVLSDDADENIDDSTDAKYTIDATTVDGCESVEDSADADFTVDVTSVDVATVDVEENQEQASGDQEVTANIQLNSKD